MSNVGIANLVSFLQNTAPYRRALRAAEYGDLERDRAALEQLSPINHIDKLRDPLLIIQGVSDPRVPVGEALQMYRAMAGKGVDGGLILFPDEGHGAAKRENQVLQLGHSLWFSSATYWGRMEEAPPKPAASNREKSMSPKALEDYLHQHIPLSAAMAVSVAEASGERVILHAPLAPNINHRATVFGGSASAVAILAAWCLVFMRLRERGLPGRVIIHGNSMRYDKPIAAGFLARAAAPDEAAWDKLERALRRGRMGGCAWRWRWSATARRWAAWKASSWSCPAKEIPSTEAPPAPRYRLLNFKSNLNSLFFVLKRNILCRVGLSDSQ